MQEISGVEVIDIEPIENGKSLKATASVRLGSITIHGFKIVEEQDKQPWVSVPQFEWTTKAGNRRWKDVIELKSQLKARIAGAVLKVYNNSQS